MFQKEGITHAALGQSFDLHQIAFAEMCPEEGREPVIVHGRSGKGSNTGGRICTRRILTHIRHFFHRASSRHPQSFSSTGTDRRTGPPGGRCSFRPFPDSQGSHNRTPSLLKHSPRKTYSTPLIQQTQAIFARCVISLGSQDRCRRVPWSAVRLVPKRSSVGSNMANSVTSGLSCG